jgi:D-amino-acid dehydrogenase
LCAAAGVRFRHDTTVTALAQGGAGATRRIDGVRIRNERGTDELVTADAYLVCMGSYSPQLTRPLGINLMIYPAKGYSVTMPVANPAKAYTVSLTDDEHKLVFSRLGNRLRVAGTAELDGYSTTLNPVRCNAILQRAEALFPGAGDAAQAQFWTGLRPATPSNVPCIGRSDIANLYLNTGHGTLGWTHACGSGKAIADIISGRRPEVDFAFCGGPPALTA